MVHIFIVNPTFYDFWIFSIILLLLYVLSFRSYDKLLLLSVYCNVVWDNITVSEVLTSAVCTGTLITVPLCTIYIYIYIFVSSRMKAISINYLRGSMGGSRLFAVGMLKVVRGCSLGGASHHHSSDGVSTQQNFSGGLLTEGAP